MKEPRNSISIESVNEKKAAQAANGRPAVSKRMARIDEYEEDRSEHVRVFIQALADWIREFVDGGWEAYWLSVSFRVLPVEREAKVRRMHEAIRRLFAELKNGFAVNPRHEDCSPIGVFVPEFAVLKSEGRKKNGITNPVGSMHGVVLIKPRGGARNDLQQCFRAYSNRNLADNIRSVHLRPLVHAGYVASFILSGFFAGSVLPGEVLELNWRGSP